MKIKQRTTKEIEQAIHKINDDFELSFAYREDVIKVLRWVLGDKKFVGL